jgi:hypothetical protein
VQFCGRYLEVIIYEPSVQLLRVTVAETARFPEAAAQHYDVMFTEVLTRLSSYLRATFALPARVSADAAQRLLGQILFPLLPRALFGLEQCIAEFDPRALSPQVDLRPVRKAVAELIESLPKTKG